MILPPIVFVPDLPRPPIDLLRRMLSGRTVS
jgi:hypothetical protein